MLIGNYTYIISNPTGNRLLMSCFGLLLLGISLYHTNLRLFSLSVLIYSFYSIICTWDYFHCMCLFQLLQCSFWSQFLGTQPKVLCTYIISNPTGFRLLMSCFGLFTPWYFGVLYTSVSIFTVCAYFQLLQWGFLDLVYWWST